jgi:hypothetical protein
LKQFEPIYGHYLKVDNLGDSVRLSTDRFGLFKLYRYAHLEKWAVSDSIFELVKYAKATGGDLSHHTPTAYAFLTRHGVGQQLSSFKTAYSEIELIPHWYDVLINGDGMNLVEKPPVVFSENLAEAISEAGSFFSSLTKSYIDSELDPFILLSAGLDSRCTAVAMASGLSAQQRLNIKTYTMKSGNFLKERDIALSLSKTLGMTILDQAKPQLQPTWQEWKYTYLGAHTLLAPFSRFTVPDLAFGGSCAEIIKPFYDWSDGISDIAFPETVPEKNRDDVMQDIQAAMSSYSGGFSDHLSEDDKHYQMFRNRYHFGSGVRDSIFNYAPLVFSIISTRKTPQDVSAMYRILYELGGPEVFNHPFDEEAKTFNSEIPNDWREDAIEGLNIFDREIFFTVPKGRNYLDLTGGTENNVGHPEEGMI